MEDLHGFQLIDAPSEQFLRTLPSVECPSCGLNVTDLFGIAPPQCPPLAPSAPPISVGAGPPASGTPCALGGGDGDADGLTPDDLLQLLAEAPIVSVVGLEVLCLRLCVSSWASERISET